MVRFKTYLTLVRYASKLERKYGTLVRRESNREVRSTYMAHVPYRTAILAHHITTVVISSAD